VLGTLIGFDNNTALVFKNGYFVSVDFSGKFPVSQIWWTANNCTGTGYLNDGNGANAGYVMGTEVVIFSGQTNSLYVPTGAGASATSIPAPGIQSIENSGLTTGPPNFISSNPDGSSNCSSQASATHGGWPLTALNAATALGWTVSGTPLEVAGPLKFQ
jgi:hypothetical protein